MAILPIVVAGDPVLHTPTAPVTEPVADLADLIRDMYETMDAAHGVGLAANQVGVGKRLFVYDCPDADGVDHRGCVINPVLTTSALPETMPADDGSEDEGCLSVPGYSFPTNRAAEATVTGVDENGEPVTVHGTGLLARCLQHEVDHLDGLLYTDVLTGRWRRRARKEIKRNRWTEGGITWTPGVDPDPFGHDDPDDSWEDAR